MNSISIGPGYSVFNPKNLHYVRFSRNFRFSELISETFLKGYRSAAWIQRPQDLRRNYQAVDRTQEPVGSWG